MEHSNPPQFREAAFWKRTLHMILFAIAYSIAELIVVLVILVQFLSILVTGSASERLLRFGNSLSAYVRQILRFVMYNTEAMPYPFSDWPQEPGGGERWLDRAGGGAMEPGSESASAARARPAGEAAEPDSKSD